MDSYNFTYKDVLKRRERMINRVESWEVRLLAFIMVVVTAFFTFSSLCFASETENVDLNVVDSLQVNFNSNYFVTSPSNYVAYFEVEKGFIYHITKVGGNYPSPLVSSSSIPSNNVVYSIITSIDTGDTYDYYAVNDDFLVLSTTSNAAGNTFVITRESANGYGNAVDNLVNNVGVNQIWDVFGSGINFVYVVVIVALGIFLIALAIRKISKGKSEF